MTTVYMVCSACNLPGHNIKKCPRLGLDGGSSRKKRAVLAVNDSEACGLRGPRGFLPVVDKGAMEFRDCPRGYYPVKQAGDVVLMKKEELDQYKIQCECGVKVSAVDRRALSRHQGTKGHLEWASREFTRMKGEFDDPELAAALGLSSMPALQPEEHDEGQQTSAPSPPDLPLPAPVLPALPVDAAADDRLDPFALLDEPTDQQPTLEPHGEQEDKDERGEEADEENALLMEDACFETEAEERVQQHMDQEGREKEEVEEKESGENDDDDDDDDDDDENGPPPPPQPIYPLGATAPLLVFAVRRPASTTRFDPLVAEPVVPGRQSSSSSLVSQTATMGPPLVQTTATAVQATASSDGLLLRRPEADSLTMLSHNYHVGAAPSDGTPHPLDGLSDVSNPASCPVQIAFCTSGAFCQTTFV